MGVVMIATVAFFVAFVAGVVVISLNTMDRWPLLCIALVLAWCAAGSFVMTSLT
jgi:hypothetical protein